MDGHFQKLVVPGIAAGEDGRGVGDVKCEFPNLRKKRFKLCRLEITGKLAAP
jgi:hypothetical protein